ncbi:unnamed protein product [Allacma fusca]|uniref:CAAX prenyl protease 2 n=1 Tax=Allacma fusca TaxID=39272 RepID=A0A8J2JVU5_9HEXA|nr:unnamed protein product [Allacma fusca]
MCGVIACCYVGSLYIWKNDKSEASTHPNVMKKRFVSVTGASVVAPLIAYPFIQRELLENHSILEIFGVRTEGLFLAIIVPLLLTSILFLGPLAVEYSTGVLKVYAEPSFWLATLKQLIGIRNYIVAPITEELVFRACIISLIGSCLSTSGIVIVCPLFFGAAHLHHAIEQIRLGVPVRRAILISAFQFIYTSIFGAYSAYLFLRTGHLIAPVLVHSFCNHMGFPDFASVVHFQQPKKAVIIGAYVVGLITWFYCLQPLTTPSLYSNSLPWVESS